MSSFPSLRELRKTHGCVLDLNGVNFVELYCEIAPNGKKYVIFEGKTGFLHKKTVRLSEEQFEPAGRGQVKLTSLGPGHSTSEENG